MAESGHVATSAPYLYALDDMRRMADGSRKHLGSVAIITVYVHNLTHQSDTVFTDVVKTAYKKAKRKLLLAFAASSACPMENTSVQLVRIPFPEKYLIAFMPSAMQGTFTTICGLSAASSSPSLIMPS